MALSPTTTATNPRIAKLIELEVAGRIKPEHEAELNTYRAQGLAPRSAGAAANESERKASSFLTRAMGANRSYEEQNIGPRSYIGQKLADGAPDLLNTLPGVVGNSPARQVSDSAQDEFIAASLRQDSGAAIPPAELEKQRRIYFPMPGDGPEALEQKRAARLRAISGLANSTGRSITPEQQAQLEKMRPDLQWADTGVRPDAPPDDGAPANPPPPPDATHPIGIHDAIDQAAGVNPTGPLRVDVNDEASAQTPEFRAGLAKLLADPKVTGDEIRAYWDKNAPGWAAGEKDATPPPAAPLAVERGKGGLVEGADAIIRGAADTVSLGFGDEIAAGARTLFNDKSFGENLRAERGVDRYDEANSPWLRGAGQFAGAMVPIGGAWAAGARGAVDSAKVGGTLGAVYGVGSGDTLADRFTGGVKSGLAGAAGGLVLGKLSDMYVNRAGRTPPGGGDGRAQEAADLSEATQALGVDMLPADAAGPTTRLMTSAFAASPGGVHPITKAARRVQQQAGDALDTMAAREGPVLTKEAAGEAAREGALKFRSGSRESIGREYDRAAEMAGDARVAPKQALEVLDRNIAELSEVPGGADGLKVLSDLRDELAQRGTISVQGIRGMRTQLRQKFMKDGLRGSDVERRVNDVIEAASEDLISSLTDQGKGGAAKAYAAADKAWSERVKTLDDVVMPILGKKGERSGEQIVDSLNAAAKGNNARLAKFFDVLPEEEAGAARATLINGLGQAAPGAQGAKGGEFSLDTFLTRWNQIGQGAKNTFFRGENRKAIDQLALIAERSKAANRFRNHSNTGLVGTTMVTGATAMASFATLGKVLAAQYLGGRLLASPHVARAMLAIAKAKDPAAVTARVSALSNIATRDPTIRNEVIQLQQGLMSALNDNAPRAGSVAASPDQRPNEQ